MYWNPHEQIEDVMIHPRASSHDATAVRDAVAARFSMKQPILQSPLFARDSQYLE